ncbi:MAG TPA: UvrD-helicase domain-containing protein, partial [Myxococcota bacterium]|nr:UvrD-helicase domain-containing protein [Myxococcota bacterium]
ARALRGALDHLCVQTIHAYCRRLLVEHALDARLHPKLEIDADRRAQAQVVRSVLESALESAYEGASRSAFLALAACGIGPRELESALAALLEAGVTSAELLADPATPDRVEALVERLRDSLARFRASGGDALSSVRSATSSQTASRLADALASLDAARPSDRAGLEAWIAGLAARWDEPHAKRLREWAKGTFNQGEQRALAERAQRLSACAAELALVLEHALALDLERLDALREALAAPLAAAHAQLRGSGVLTFSALLAETRALLRDRPDVARRIRAGIDQLLVDEFQDTDQCQCEIIRALALAEPAAERPGLFLVGDPKQSIYGWRRADLGAYDAFIDDVGAAGGVVVHLSVNFRSAPMILDEVERAIAPVMTEARGVQPAFQLLLACPERADDAGFCEQRRRPVEHWMPTAWDAQRGEPRSTSASEAARIEAAALARELRALRDRHGMVWKSIAVLFRSRTDWEVYLAALREADIPYAAEGDRSYYRRREIIDATALLRCVLDPSDAIALIGYLRSAAVGVPDAAWLPLWSRGFAEQLATLAAPDRAALESIASAIREVARSMPAGVPGLERIAGWEESLIDAVEGIAELRASFAHSAPDLFVDALRARTLFEATESARQLGAWRCASLEHFFRKVAAALEAGRCAHELLRELRAATAREELAEPGLPADLAVDAVRVMTIHGAKGLDFDHVYLMQLHKGVSHVLGSSTEVAELAGRRELRLIDAPTLGWDCALRERERTAAAERVRLLYVAMTRAKQRLVMSGLWPAHQQRATVGQAIELLGPRIAASEGLAEWLSGAARAGASDFVDPFGARWVLPALDAKPDAEAAAAAARSRGAELPSERDLVESSRRLAALRRSAAARMARPIGATASERAHPERGQEARREQPALPAGRDRARTGEREGARTGEGDGGRVNEGEGARTRDGEGAAIPRAIGSAIHLALERFDFAAEPAAEVARQREVVARALAEVGAGERAESAVAAGTRLWDRIVRGRSFAQLRALSDRIVARELPVLCPPGEGDAPLGYVSGAIDLVYREPDSERLVVVDYKTDAVSDPAELERRAAAYAEQGSVYTRALASALELAYTPRFELWFLDADRIVA